VTEATVERESRLAVATGELAKLPAFVRRDFLIAWSYRVAFLGDIVGLVFGLIVFYFVGKMVDPSTVPSYAGDRPTYLEWVVVGVAMGAFISLGLGRVMAAIRSEQMTGTLESLLMTPTATTTIQIGSAVYDLAYVPLRTAVFLVVATLLFGLDYDAGGVLRATIILVAFIPFVWGLGVLSAAGVLTLRRGAGLVGLGTALLTLASGAYFPVELLPDWIEETAKYNPIAVTLEGMRETLIGGAGWDEVWSDVAVVLPAAVLALAVGIGAFKLALRRERRKGTMGLY
jgi:ABC-2 type transport system permease protein